jgi:hypothetical protein
MKSTPFCKKLTDDIVSLRSCEHFHRGLFAHKARPDRFALGSVR